METNNHVYHNVSLNRYLTKREKDDSCFFPALFPSFYPSDANTVVVYRPPWFIPLLKKTNEVYTKVALLRYLYKKQKHESAFYPSSSSLATTVAVYQPPWNIHTPRGAVLVPHDYEICRIHSLCLNNPLPYEDFCSQLPFSIMGTRKWNLPGKIDVGKLGILFRSREGKGNGNIPILETCAYWRIVSVSEVVDGLTGETAGVKKVYSLWFGDVTGLISGREVSGEWNAEVFTSVDRPHAVAGCALVALYTTNRRLVELEYERVTAEHRFRFSLQQNLKFLKNNGVPQDLRATYNLPCDHILSANQEIMASREREAMMARCVYRIGWDEKKADAAHVVLELPVETGLNKNKRKREAREAGLRTRTKRKKQRGRG